jgi:hypothetical protein
MADLLVLDQRIHYRHNVHCPACGRFSCKMPDNVGGTICHVHGWVMKETKEGAPIITMTIDIVPVTTIVDKKKHELEILGDGLLALPLAEITKEQVLAYDPVTEPIDIIPTLEELEPA